MHSPKTAFSALLLAVFVMNTSIFHAMKPYDPDLDSEEYPPAYIMDKSCSDGIRYALSQEGSIPPRKSWFPFSQSFKPPEVPEQEFQGATLVELIDLMGKNPYSEQLEDFLIRYLSILVEQHLSIIRMIKVYLARIKIIDENIKKDKENCLRETKDKHFRYYRQAAIQGIESDTLRREDAKEALKEGAKRLETGLNGRIKGTFRIFWAGSSGRQCAQALLTFLSAKCQIRGGFEILSIEKDDGAAVLLADSLIASEYWLFFFYKFKIEHLAKAFNKIKDRVRRGEMHSDLVAYIKKELPGERREYKAIQDFIDAGYDASSNKKWENH